MFAYLERFIKTSTSLLETTPSKPAVEISTVRIRKTNKQKQLPRVLMLQVSKCSFPDGPDEACCSGTYLLNFEIHLHGQ